MVVAIIVLGFTPNSPGFAQCKYRPASPRLPVGLKLNIRAEKTVPEILRPLLIHIEISNQSTGSITMRDNLWPARDYELYVRDANGKEARLTDWGRQIRTGPIKGSGNDMTLAPGEKLETQQNLSRIYDIASPGTYTVQACRELYDWGNLYSNKITIPFVLPSSEEKMKFDNRVGEGK